MRGIGLWIGLAAAVVVCQHWLASCIGAESCVAGMGGPHLWASLGLVAGGSLAVVTALACALRTLWLIVASSVGLDRIPTSRPPQQLLDLAQHLGIRRLRFLLTSSDLVFCAGAIHPTVLISSSVWERLGTDEVKAVLVHELEHACSFDPLRRVAWRAAAEILFFLPLIDWLRRRHVENSELSADRRAVELVGRKPVASALWSLGSNGVSVAVAAFSGTVELRVAQLLGDPLPRRLPPASLVAISVGGVAFALSLMACAVQIVGLIP